MARKHKDGTDPQSPYNQDEYDSYVGYAILFLIFAGACLCWLAWHLDNTVLKCVG